MHAELVQLKRYLQETLGIKINPIKWDEGNRLPFFLTNVYSFFKLKIMGYPFLLMHDISEKEHSPAIVHMHMDKVRAKWDGEVVYMRSRITAYNRKRLIGHNLPFVVPGNQMYLPMLGIDLREHFKKLRTKTHKFAPSTQALAIYLLLEDTKRGIFTPTDMAANLNYSAMTMTRAFDELESADLGEIFPEGRERYIQFTEPTKDTWEKIQPFLSSPVKKRFYINPMNTELLGPQAGFTALSEYTMLAAPANQIIALSGKRWISFRYNQPIIEFPSLEPDALEIEVWRYDPNLFVKDDVVDRLSLYLSLNDFQDERVEGALKEMIRGLRW